MEKNLFKIAGIIAMIIGILYCVTIIGAIVGVFLIAGGSAMMGYSKLSNEELEEKKCSILGWSIFFLFFTVIGGVLGLIGYVTIGRDIVIGGKESYIDELQKLKELKDKGIITEKEYEAKKKKILNI